MMNIIKKKISDICDKGTSSLAKKDLFEKSGPYPVYGADGMVGKVDFFQQDKKYIAIIKDGAGVGRVYRFDEKTSILGTMQYILPKDSVDYSFLYYALKLISFDKYVKGAAIPHIYFKDYSHEKIPLPPIEEQKKIAARLDAVSDLLTKQKQLLAEQDTLIQSLFYDMFGIPFKNDKNFQMLSIGDIVSDVQYGTSKKADTSGSTPILRMNNIKYSGEMDYSDLKFIDLGDETSKYLLKKGDILFNRTNSKELVGKTGIYNLDSLMVYAGYLIRVRLKDNFLPICFSVYMNTPYLKAFFLEKCKSIVGMANINAKELQRIPIYLPPLELQEKFVAIVEQIETEKSTIKSAITETQTLFDALMAEYFEE